MGQGGQGAEGRALEGGRVTGLSLSTGSCCGRRSSLLLPHRVTSSKNQYILISKCYLLGSEELGGNCGKAVLAQAHSLEREVPVEGTAAGGRLLFLGSPPSCWLAAQSLGNPAPGCQPQSRKTPVQVRRTPQGVAVGRVPVHLTPWQMRNGFNVFVILF